MKKKNLIKIGIVGLGHWGPNLARIVNESTEANLYYCCDLSRKRLSYIKGIYPRTKITTNFDDLLKDVDLNAIIIATPASLHYKLAKKTLLAEKDVLVEKPLTLSKEEAIELVKIAKKNKRVLMVDHTFIFNPAIEKIKDLIDKKEIGKIHYGYGDYTAFGPIRSDVSALWDLSTHFLYTIPYLFSKPINSIAVSGKAFLSKKFVDVAFINLEFSDKTIFNFRVSWADPIKTRSFVIVGDKKMVKFEDTSIDGRVVIYDRGIKSKQIGDNSSFLKHFFVLRYGDIVLPHIPNDEPLKIVFKNFLYSLKNRTPTLISNEDAINLVTLLEAAQHSLNKGGLKVTIFYNPKTKMIDYKRFYAEDKKL